jgi:hypothetical protein
VLVVDCDAALDTDLARVQMKLAEYARWWIARGADGGEERVDEVGGGGGGGGGSSGSVGGGRRLYLKDWNFASDCPGYGAYETPPHFADDWLNAYWDERGVEQAGLYIHPLSSSTCAVALAGSSRRLLQCC